MKTIFDYNPTESELIELFGFDKETDTMAYGFLVFKLPIKNYDKENSEDGKLLDLALLFEKRKLLNEANAIWKQIPDIEKQYRGGFDYVSKSI
ncbi:hypothetical protein ACFOWA_17740 [Pedobacter lithocola]|uniref:Uncharacterized protein n=1 Tax=Pedobacter lithocola TaxID=1908239 RepID=A0ABV8PG48_9SPHI